MERKRTYLDEINDAITQALSDGDWDKLELWYGKKEEHTKQRVDKNLRDAKQRDYITLKFRDDARGVEAIVHPSSREKGKWQVSFISRGRVFTHDTYDTKEDAIRGLSGVTNIQRHILGEECELTFIEGQTLDDI
jgi:hypothetical protein